MLLARLEPHQAFAARERVRSAGHRLDREAAAALRHSERVAAVDHDVGVGGVEPQPRDSPVVWARDEDAGKPVVVALEITEARVEDQIREAALGAKIVDRPRDRF